MNRHHIDRRPEAPLWPQDSRWYDFDDPQGSAISTDRIRDMLEECADRTELDVDIHPHMFRHTAMTRMSNSERLNPQEIQHIAGWADKRMLEAYDQTSAQKRNSSIHNATGYSDGVDDEGSTADPRPCGNCRAVIKPGERFCANCGIGADRFEPDHTIRVGAVGAVGTVTLSAIPLEHLPAALGELLVHGEWVVRRLE
jgi:hypothetical protein